MRVRRGRYFICEQDMTPMIDMTFQLIAFFMFTINFNNDLLNEEVKLPVAEVARPVDEAPEGPVFLNVSRQGVLLLPGNPLQIAEPAELAKINSYLRSEANFAKRQMRDKGEDLSKGLSATIVIRAHEQVDYGSVQDLIRACRDAGFTKFLLRVNLKADED